MKTIPLGINISNFIESYRNIGYSIETAIADIIDNSIFAKAKNIQVNMLWEDFSTESPIVQIIDDGIGMSNEELIESMRLACKSPSDYRDPTDLGRFGLGLKSASFSQCKVLTVGSRREDKCPCCKQWDISYICKQNEFLLNDCTLEESGISELIPMPHGTIVQWTEMDNLNIPDSADESKKESYWNDIKRKVLNHISMTFGSFVNDIAFYFNGNPIKLWDPFLTDNTSTYVETEEGESLGEDRIIRIKTYILPPKLTEEEQTELSRNRCLNDLQGFYLYRNNRLIIAGSWLDLKGLTKKEIYRLAHIRLDIDNTMDNLWHIDIKKEHATCPPELQDKLVSIAKHARATSAKAFSTRKKHIRTQKLVDEKKAYVWISGTKNQKPFFEINKQNPVIEAFSSCLNADQRKQFNSLIKYIENYIPVMAIISSEANSNEKYVNNNFEDIDDKEIIETFNTTVESIVEKTGNYDIAIQTCIFSEPFFSYYEVIKEYLKEQNINI